ncbi:MAG: glycosyltransferase family 2 protein [Planctomycetes bacterium]|nr:glycosyltransferase family 2 protein [Planctomycetota bacterium]
MPAASVVIPAYNEEAAVGEVVTQIKAAFLKAGMDCEIIVVDDNSTDRTADVAAAASAIVLRHETNRGYGAALKTGIRSAQHELVCIIDADGTYPPERLPEFVGLCDSHDMVVGARTTQTSHVPLLRRPAKWFLTLLANYMTGIKIPDLNSGMRVMRRSFVREYFDILPDRFSFTTTITLAGLSDGYRLKFVPIDYQRRIGQSKIKPIDALNFLILIVRTMTYFRPLRLFLPVSLALFAGAAVKLSIDIIKFDNIEDTSVMLFLAGLQTLFVGMLADMICFVRRRTRTDRD